MREREKRGKERQREGKGKAECVCEWWGSYISYTVSGQSHCSSNRCRELAAFSN